jgi:hypothetical protein
LAETESWKKEKDLRKWHENEKEQLGVSYGTVFYSFSLLSFGWKFSKGKRNGIDESSQ